MEHGQQAKLDCERGRGRRAREVPTTKRGGLGQETRVAKIAKLHRIRLGDEKQKPSSGRERFRVGGWVRSPGRSHRF